MDQEKHTSELAELVSLSHFVEMGKDIASARSVGEVMRQVMHHIGDIFAPMNRSLLLKVVSDNN